MIQSNTKSDPSQVSPDRRHVGQVLLLRHAQASAQSENYDELSSLGHIQSQRVGEYWVQHAMQFDAIYMGALKRHAQTYAGIHAAYLKAGQTLAIPCVMPELNEYDFRSVLKAFQAQFPENEDLRAGRLLVVLKHALLAWAREQLNWPGLESYADFQIRVSAAAKRIASEHGRVLVVTSGGVISLFAQRALGLEDEAAGSLNFAIKNTAVNEFRVSKNAWQLQSFNTLPHLSEPEHAALHTRI
jgi:broad specificity phosphatase PhoE